MWQFIVSNATFIVIGALIGHLLMRTIQLKSECRYLCDAITKMKYDLPSKSVADYEHKYLENRVRNIEEECRTLRLLIKHEIAE